MCCGSLCAVTLHDKMLCIKNQRRSASVALAPMLVCLHRLIPFPLQVHFDCKFRGIDAVSSRYARTLGGNRTIAEVCAMAHAGQCGLHILRLQVATHHNLWLNCKIKLGLQCNFQPAAMLCSSLAGTTHNINSTESPRLCMVVRVHGLSSAD